MMRFLFAGVLALSVACRATETPQLTIATTTSVVNSGLLESILPAFEAQRAVVVRTHAVGSGRALEMLQDGEVALVIAHAPAAESEYLGRHHDWFYAKIAYNEFVIVGPASDPLLVSAASGAVDAFRRIADGGGRFISRGDRSGTHEREQSLWAAAGRTTTALSTSGASMAVTLRQANELNAYTLSDDATYRQLQPQLDLKILFKGDDRLMNTYAVIAPQSDAESMALATWLRGPGQTAIAQHTIAGVPAYHRWPDNCPDQTPAALPCR